MTRKWLLALESRQQSKLDKYFIELQSRRIALSEKHIVDTLDRLEPEYSTVQDLVALREALLSILEKKNLEET